MSDAPAIVAIVVLGAVAALAIVAPYLPWSAWYARPSASEDPPSPPRRHYPGDGCHQDDATTSSHRRDATMMSPVPDRVGPYGSQPLRQPQLVIGRPMDLPVTHDLRLRLAAPNA